MLKKLLTLSLALVMLSVAVMASPVTYTFAADLEDAEEEANVPADEEFDGNAMELIRIKQTEADGVVSQSAVIQNWGTAYTAGGNWWLLAKIDIDEGWLMDSVALTLTTTVGVRGTTTGYYAPITKADYDAANAIAGTSNTINSLLEPQNIPGADSSTLTRESTGVSTQSIPVIGLTSSAYVNSYDGEYLYVAIQFVNSLGNITNFSADRQADWKLTVEGKKAVVVPTVPADETFDINAFTVLRITENAGVQTATKQNIGTTTTDGSTISATDRVWLLVKVAVGKNWVMDKSQLTMSTETGGEKSLDSNAYYLPITKAVWDDAADEAIESPLTKPSASGAKKVLLRAASGTGSFTSTGVKTATFDGSDYISAYDGENLYFAIELENASVGRTRWKNWSLKVSGKKNAPAVTDFSDSVITWDSETGAYTVTTATASGTAMLIVASFNDDTMVDAKVATIDAATKADGVISGIIEGLQAGKSVKIFLWDKLTLAPAIGVSDF